MLRRRDFLTVCATAAWPLVRMAQAQTSISTVQLDDRLSVITGAGNNIVCYKSDAGTLLVDAGDEAHGQDVLKASDDVRTVINTHWHTESTGANEAMAQAGAKIVSHVNTRLWMTQEIIHEWEHRTFPPRAKAALPQETFYTTRKLAAGQETIECGLMPMAHTDGDIYVYFRQANVLVAGDVVQRGRLPYLDFVTGGWIGGMQDAHQTLLRLANDQTRIIPSVGPVLSKTDVQANLDLLTKLRTQLVKLMKQGLGPKEMIEGKALKEFEGQLSGDPEPFLFEAYRGMWGHARELGGIV